MRWWMRAWRCGGDEELGVAAVGDVSVRCGSILALTVCSLLRCCPTAPLLANQHQFFSGKLYVLL